MPTRSGTSQRVAIVGASSLLGKELKLVLEDRNFPATDFVLLDESHVAGTLTEAAGEATFIKPLDSDSLEGARFVFFAGNSETAAKNWEAGIRGGASVIDLTGGVPAESGAFLGSRRSTRCYQLRRRWFRSPARKLVRSSQRGTRSGRFIARLALG